MGCATILLAAAAGAAAAPAPDIAITARVQAREVTIQQQGRASARVTATPSAGETIEVERNLPRGQASYRNLDLKVNVEARLADPNAGPALDAQASAHSEPQTGD